MQLWLRCGAAGQPAVAVVRRHRGQRRITKGPSPFCAIEGLVRATTTRCFWRASRCLALQAGGRRRGEPAGGRGLQAGALLQVPAPGLPGGLAHVGRCAAPASRAGLPVFVRVPSGTGAGAAPRCAAAWRPAWCVTCRRRLCRPPCRAPAARAGPLVDSGFQANLTALLVRLGSEHPHHTLYQVGMPPAVAVRVARGEGKVRTIAL